MSLTAKINTSIIGLFLLISGTALNAEKLPITNKSTGKSIQVKPISLENNKLTFTLKGKQHTIKISELTDASVKVIKEALEKQTSAASQQFDAINKAIGHPLFSNKSLWNETSKTIAKRLKWPLESQKEDSSSYRLYPRANYTFLGTRPYCATLYGGADGTPVRFSLIFANKGDYGSSAGFGEDHFKEIHPDKEPPESLEKAIELDAEIISQTLTEHLKQEPSIQYYGEKTEKRKVKRWDVTDHSLILTSIDSEYTSLLIVSKENADLEGKVAFVKDADLKKKLIKNVHTKPNGDVIIENIPMVNQGPKGYCAPATFERAMNYMSIPADMYELATAATKVGGGTNTYLLADNCKRIVRSKARRIKDLELNKDLEIRKIKKFIDKGVPVLWQMRSIAPYNKLVNKRTSERKKIQNFTTWSETIQKEADQNVSQFRGENTNYHICMIIGYNEATKELAVSDSWGARYELRWVHIDLAKAVTSSGGFAIDF